MTSIHGFTKRPRIEEVGFECGLCKKNFRTRYDVKSYTTEWDRVVDIADWPVCSYIAYLRYDHPDGEGDVTIDFCGDCYRKLRDLLKEMGVKIVNDG